MLGLELVQGCPEALLLMGGDSRVGLVQEGAGRLGDLEQLSLLGLELLELRLGEGNKRSEVMRSEGEEEKSRRFI